MKTTFISLLLALFCFVGYSQKTVTGTITASDTKEGLPQVSVKVKGTTTGVVTDLDGKFSVTVPAGSNVLVFSYVGYTEKEVDVNTVSGELAIVLEVANIGLNQVVVSASKNEEKILDAPASVSVVNAEQIQTQANTSIVDNLRTLPSVDILKQGLLSSNVTIRGFNNIFSGAMLTIVDNRLAKVPSLRVNAYQLVPTNSYDIQRMEVVRGPGSALYGPDAADGVLAIFTKSPLDMEKNFETTISYTGGLRGNAGAGSGYAGEDEDAIDRGFMLADLYHAGKFSKKAGYKVSANYTGGTDWRYYDPQEPRPGIDTLVFGSVRDGRVFEEDTTIAHELFDRDFQIRKIAVDARLDFRLNKDATLIFNGGSSTARGIELTGLGAGQVKDWTYWYTQARFTWKKLFIQYFLNSSNSGDTYIIPEASPGENTYEVQLLIDKSKVHVGQVQHSVDVAKDKLKLVYGADLIFTNPRTEGTINGRFEDEDNIIQTGGYIQGEYDIIKKLTAVAAFRLDWQNDVGTQFSPRAALVYKPNPRNTLRATYNRAFSSPTALNLSLDIARGRIPNGINIRGIGNRNGYNYMYDDNGLPMFISPYNSTWYSVGDQSDNDVFFDGMVDIIIDNLSGAVPLSDSTKVKIRNDLTAGISEPGGTIDSVQQVAIDYVKYRNLLRENPATAFQQSIFDSLGGIKDLKPIANQITNTWEIGYKGILFDKLMVTADFYYSRISDYVGPLTISTASVMLNPIDVLAALGGPNQGPGILLYDNLQKPSAVFPGVFPTYDDLLLGLGLDGLYTDSSVVTPVAGTTWDELLVILTGASSQIPVGSITPDDPLVQSDAILTYINLGTIDVGGMDLNFTYLINDRWSVSGGYSYVTKDRIDLEGAQDGYVALNAPKHKTSVTIENKCKIGLTSRLSYRWYAEFPGNSAVYVGIVPARHLLDLTLCYKLWFSKKTLVCADIQNILNKKYQSFPGTPYMGITAMLKIAHTF